MATYLFTYRVPRRPLAEVIGDMDEAGRRARVTAWNDWFVRLGDHVVQRGDPVNDARTVGTPSPDLRIGGYSIIEARDFDEAEALAAGCPGLVLGGAVEVGEFVDIPAATTQGART